jgi:hypothetical protein
LCSFTSDFNRGTAGYSPDRLDALVWALSELMVQAIEQPQAHFGVYGHYPANQFGCYRGGAASVPGQPDSCVYPPNVQGFWEMIGDISERK